MKYNITLPLEPPFSIYDFQKSVSLSFMVEFSISYGGLHTGVHSREIPTGISPSVQKSIEKLIFSSFCHIPIFISSQYVFQSIFYFFSFPQPSAGVSPIGFLPLPKNISFLSFCHISVFFSISFSAFSISFLPTQPSAGVSPMGSSPLQRPDTFHNQVRYPPQPNNTSTKRIFICK